MTIKQIENNKKLKTEFIINKQTAENLSNKEMVSSILSGLHYFCKQAGVFFKDINQKDECFIGDKKAKIYTRDAIADEDMLVYESYYKKHPEIDIYITCKTKGGNYWYVGYVAKDIVDNTRVVKMIGSESDKESKDMRRIFAEQYKPLSDLIEIYESDKKEEEIIQQNYIPIHTHSEWSIGDGFGTCKYIVEQLYRKGFKSAALTDHGTLAGVWEFQKTCLEKNIKPIIGYEAYIKIPELEKRCHITIIIKNKKGWKNILKIHDNAVREGFYYKPIINFDKLIEHGDGLIILSGCMSGIFYNLLNANNIEVTKKYLDILKEKFKNDFYGEIGIHNILNYREIMKQFYKLCKDKNIKCALSTDSHYPSKEDKIIHDAIKAISMRKKYGEAGFDDDCFYLMQEQDIENKIKDSDFLKSIISKLKTSTFEIFDKANFQISPPNALDTLPKFLPTPVERKEKLKQLCIEGLEANTPYKYEGKIKERLDLEMNRMLDKNYENYFLVVWDLIKWAKENNIFVGPGRGSVGASLAAYALNITECDSIKFDLLFDRFLSEIRRDMPDIDMDFQDNRRKEVFEYLINKYGEKNCAKVSTYSRFHPKGILRDIGRIFNIPISEIENICKLVLVRSGGDARASFGLMDTFEEFEDAKKFKIKYQQASEIAVKLEGHIRHKGIHAAAMVVCEDEVSNYVPINKLNGIIVTEWEKQPIEDMKLIKLDILGLKTLSVLSDCKKDLKIKLPTSFEDKKVYEKVFQTGETLGVFQFETVGLSKLSSSLKPKEFRTLYDATTLFRPGALHSGQTMLYVNRHLGKNEIKYEHPLLEKITKDTKGIILYQEQIMQIMNSVGGMSWATAEMARKTITKSRGKKAFEEMRAEFVRNANRLHKMEIKEAEKLYDVVSTFGSYGFNKAHAVEYSIIGYWCAWLKTYYPEVFYKNILRHESDEIKIMNYLDDAHKNGIEIEYPHINFSEFEYATKDKKIYSGFSAIKGIGERTAQKIVDNQPYESFEDFKKRAKIGKKIISNLIISDCFRDFNINKKSLWEETDGEDYSDLELAEMIIANTTLKPKINIKEAVDFGNYNFIDIKDLSEEHSNKLGNIRGFVTDILNKDKLIRGELKNHIHAFEQHMIYLNVNDGTGNLAVQINPNIFDKYKDIVYDLKGKPIVIYGKFAKEGRKIYAELIEMPGQTKDIKTMNNSIGDNECIIISSSPAVSKKGKSYYRIELSDGEKGLCFQAPAKLYAGQKVSYTQFAKPFINIYIK